MRKVFVLIAAIAGSLSSFAQTDIANARTFGIGQTVTISGVVTNGSELGSIRYMQDGTAGLAAYGSALSGVSRGDSITVTGPLIEFSGLLEISPASGVINHGPAVVMPAPLAIPITSTGEALESQLIRIDNVTFVQTGMFTTGNATYQITDGVNTFDVRVNGSTNIDGTAIPTGTVSIVGEQGQFNANYQIVPRDLNDIFPYVAPSEEINVLVGGLTYLNGNTYFLGNTASTSIEIENFGVNTLTISGATFTGTNASDFSTTIVPGSVTGGSSQSYVINFAPGGTGSRFATLSITNNDSDENPYIINFEAIGTDNLATQPTANPTGMTFPIIEAYTVGAQYVAGSGASKYLVLWKNGSAITGVPTDGTTYLRGDVVGDAKVAYVGAGTSFTPRGVRANQNYFFAVYAFNGSGGFENYLTSSPALGTVSSTGENIGNYYGSITSASPTLHTDLEALINPHTQISYFLYKQTMMNEFEIRDTTNGQSFVQCVYSGERKVFDDPFDWTLTGYSREHTFAHSWMPTWPADNPEEPEYTDQHNLYPTNLNQANTPRSNLPFGDIDGAVQFNYLEGSVGYMGSQLVYEPSANQKGNVARSIFYMVTAYGFPLSGDLDSDDQDQDLLKAWHLNDLPDNYEIARNEYIYDLQGNRNPFIDSIDFACFINFDNFTYNATDCGLSIQEQLDNNFVVYPIPAKDKVFLQVNGTKILSYELLDMQGRVVASEKELSADVIELKASQFEAGGYLVRVTTTFGETQRKLIIE